MSISSAVTLNYSVIKSDYQKLLLGLKELYDHAAPWERDALKERMIDVAFKIRALDA